MECSGRCTVLIAAKALAPLILLLAAGLSNAATLPDFIVNKPELSTFRKLITDSKFVPPFLAFRQATIFAPTDEAFRNYQGNVDDTILRYHLANVAQSTDKFSDAITSELTGNPVIWITKRHNPGRQTTDIYVNDALIVEPNLSWKVPDNKEQVLHVIDKVLEPAIADSSDSALYSPDAYNFLNMSSVFRLGDHKLRKFAQQVWAHKKKNVFSSSGKNTFFMPVDAGLAVGKETINNQVIDGHIIPDNILFTRSLEPQVEYETLALGDNIKVYVTMHSDSEGNTTVASNTKVGNFNYPKGSVLAQIVKGNIPVKNGVVHLISKPLMIVDQTVYQIVSEKNGPLTKLFELLKDRAEDLLNKIEGERELTLFAPSNQAFRDADQTRLNEIISDNEKVKEVLQLHMSPQKVIADGDSWTTHSQVHEVPTWAPRQKLYFSVMGQGQNRTVTVEAGGVNASVVQPDIGATNGVVHIIDRILGVPYENVFVKLQHHPLLKKTSQVVQVSDYEDDLKDPNKRLTFFAPSDEAWEQAYREMSSAVSKLVLPKYSYQAHNIIERHLIKNAAMTMVTLAAQPGPVALVRGHLKVTEYITNDWNEEGQRAYWIELDGIGANVTRTDVECTNGIVHIINRPLFRERDVTVSRASSSLLLLQLPMLLALTILHLF